MTALRVKILSTWKLQSYYDLSYRRNHIFTYLHLNAQNFPIYCKQPFFYIWTLPPCIYSIINIILKQTAPDREILRPRISHCTLYNLLTEHRVYIQELKSRKVNLSLLSEITSWNPFIIDLILAYRLISYTNERTKIGTFKTPFVF